MTGYSIVYLKNRYLNCMFSKCLQTLQYFLILTYSSFKEKIYQRQYYSSLTTSSYLVNFILEKLYTVPENAYIL